MFGGIKMKEDLFGSNLVNLCWQASIQSEYYNSREDINVIDGECIDQFAISTLLKIKNCKGADNRLTARNNDT